MMRIILFISILFLSLNARDILTAQKQNTLYTQNMIEIEEKIAQNFEKYLLTEFTIPSFADLKTEAYLGSNFSVINKMGSDISFENVNELKIKYAITKDEYRKEKTENIDNYIVKLYNRDLHRNRTSVYEAINDNEKSYVEIILKSPEAKTIFSILKAGDKIEKTCPPNLNKPYCNNNKRTIRWYNDLSQWIEYDKISFNNGNITVSSSTLLANDKLKELSVGSYVFVENLSKYVKLTDDLSGNLQILKVD